MNYFPRGKKVRVEPFQVLLKQLAQQAQEAREATPPDESERVRSLAYRPRLARSPVS